MTAFLWTVASLGAWAAVSGLFLAVWVLAVRWLSRGAR